jgi:CspA family cold shock protein
MKGTVKFFNVGKGFGFIAGEDGKEYFVHKTGLKGGVTLNENDAVTFDIEEGDRGPKAANVAKEGSGATPESSEEAAKDSE